jgi:hypothetical protein
MNNHTMLTSEQKEILKNKFRCDIFKIEKHQFFYAEANKLRDNLHNVNNLDFVTLVTYDNNKIINIQISTEPDLALNTQFEKAIYNLPDLSINNVSMLLAWSILKNKVIENIFEVPNNYISEIALELLQDTYGYILYAEQLNKLLYACNNSSTITYKLLDEFRKGFNMRKSNIIDDLKKWVLPDGINLYELLTLYTPLSTNEGFGFLSKPQYFNAIKFIKHSKQALKIK